MINILSNILGSVMQICYQMVHNYALAIVIFTIITKVILFPLSLWVHKNSLKMICMQPAINRIKIKYFGFGDQIAEEQSELYKKEKYNPLAGIIPMFAQIILLMGLIQVIYNPLTHIFHLPNELIVQLINITGQITGIDINSSSIQMTVVDTVKNPEYYNSFLNITHVLNNTDLATILFDIQQTNMNLFGVSLALIPISAHGMTMLMPLVAGISAWILCIAQNHFNPLQAEQSQLNKVGMTIFSVGLSLFLGAYVPLGVGFYWILSNLFTILQQAILNYLVDPKKNIDYDDLEASKRELTELESIGGKKSFFSKDPYGKREKLDYKRFFSVANKHLVFYSEKNGFYKYYETIIEYLLKHSTVIIHYISSDPEDSIFQNTNPRLKTYYIGNKKLITLMMKMDADIVILTMPDLDNFHIKRSYIRKDIEYIYVPHGMDSINMTMRKGSVNHFDTIFCVGPNQKEEIEKTEIAYGLPQKNLIECGYGLLDIMRKEYIQLPEYHKNKKIILIAPSWQDDNIMDLCLENIVDNLQDKGYHIVVRPHPQYVRHCTEKIAILKEKYLKHTDIEIQSDFSSNNSVLEADILITDWSGIAYEFAYTTCKPVLFINTPMKIMNPEYTKIDTIPLNILLRDEIGYSIEVNEIITIAERVSELLLQKGIYKNKIENLVQTYVYNLGQSDVIGGKYIISRLIHKETK